MLDHGGPSRSRSPYVVEDHGFANNDECWLTGVAAFVLHVSHSARMSILRCGNTFGSYSMPLLDHRILSSLRSVRFCAIDLFQRFRVELHSRTKSSSRHLAAFSSSTARSCRDGANVLALSSDC